MKMTLKELLNMKKVIEKLIQKDVPVLVGYDLMKLVQTVSPALEIFGKSRNKLFDKYKKEEEVKGKKQDVIPKEKLEEFSKEMEKLLSREVKIETPKIKLTQLAGVKMTTADLIILERLIER